MKKLFLFVLMVCLVACSGASEQDAAAAGGNGSGNGGGNGSGGGNGNGGGNGSGGGGGAASVKAGQTGLYVNGDLVAGFDVAALEDLERHTFEDTERGVQQTGWLLMDVVQFLTDEALADGATVSVSSSSRGASAELSGSDINDAANNVVLALTNRGTLRLASTLEELDERNEWVGDVDKIEITSP